MGTPYDLVGWGDDDEGSIGTEFIEGDDDEALLEALAVSGMGDSEIVGVSKNQSAKKFLRALAARNAGAVVNRGLNRKRRYPLGFVPTSVGAGVTSQIPSAPQNLFRPERLIIPSDIAFDFGITDIKVGNTSQFVQAVEVPAALFSEVAIDSNVTFDTAEVGNQVSINARNKSGVAVEFTAGLIGTVAK